jgi:hypothetical protein
VEGREIFDAVVAALVALVREFKEQRRGERLDLH